ncbi:MAG TPA: GNAT family protein [Ktedonobacterales bacterium]|jgi:ribosomal-protein-alanine N-acetyltransferase|nr:GNAT family protein [Ktedonobacterales bacterium]
MAHYTFTPLRLRDACAMASWRYDGEYAFYNTGLFPLLLVVPLRRLLVGLGVEVYAVRDESKEVIGTFSYTRQGDAVEIGLAMRPDLTGRGLGLDFVRAGMDFARQRFAPHTFTLDVATFNRRAIAVYTRAGFAPVSTFKRRTRQGTVEFLQMMCPAS